MAVREFGISATISPAPAAADECGVLFLEAMVAALLTMESGK
jgi:hypothetical protein